MNSDFDCIQDWEFYLRLKDFLSSDTVGYLPVPLYAWRISENSTATSANPKNYLVDLSRNFVELSHQKLDEGTKIAIPENGHCDYRFGFSLSGQSNINQSCNILILCDSENDHLLLNTIN